MLSTLFTITYLFKGFKVILHTSDEGGAKCTSENWLEEGRRFYICTSCLYIVLLYTSYNAIRISTNARIEEKTVW